MGINELVTDHEIGKYFIDVQSLSEEYNIPVDDLFNLIGWYESRRNERGRERDFGRSIDVIERYLERKN